MSPGTRFSFVVLLFQVRIKLAKSQDDIQVVSPGSCLMASGGKDKMHPGQEMHQQLGFCESDLIYHSLGLCFGFVTHHRGGIGIFELKCRDVSVERPAE